MNIATEYDYTDKLQLEIIDYLSRNCYKSELMWHTMALRELNGHHYDKNDRNKSRKKLCINVYKTALKVLNSKEMWEKYLDTIVDIYQGEKNINFRQTVLDLTFQNALDNGFLQEKHYLAWIEMLEDDSKLPEVLAKATDSLPQSTELWLQRLRYYIKNEDENVNTIAKEAIKSLGGKSLEIYQILIKYYQLKSHVDSIDADTIEQVFEEAIKRQELEIVSVIRPQYLDWILMARKSMNDLKKAFEEMSHLPPPCLELYEKMIQIEMITIAPNIANIRKLYKNMCGQFGKNRTDVWLEHIKFEKKYGDSQWLPSIHNNAKNTLNPNLLPVFDTEFCLLQAKD